MKSSTQRNLIFFCWKSRSLKYALHCIQTSVIRTADHEWVLQEAKVMKHRTKKYTRYSFRKEFTTVLEKSPETTSNALLGTQWGQQIIETNVLGISSSDLVMTKFECWILNIGCRGTCHDKFPICLWPVLSTWKTNQKLKTNIQYSKFKLRRDRLMTYSFFR